MEEDGRNKEINNISLSVHLAEGMKSLSIVIEKERESNEAA